MIPFDVTLLDVTNEDLPAIKQKIKDMVVQGLTAILIQMPPQVTANYDCDMRLDDKDAVDDDPVKGLSVLLTIRRRPRGVPEPPRRMAVT